MPDKTTMDNRPIETKMNKNKYYNHKTVLLSTQYPNKIIWLH